MNGGSIRVVIALGTVVVCLLGIESATGQAAPEQKPLMAEDVFKNVQVLKGIPVDEFMGTMGFYRRLAEHELHDCHSQASGSDVEGMPTTPRVSRPRAR